MTIKYPFNKIWQKKLLSLLIVDGAVLVSEKLVKADYFEQPQHVIIASAVLKLYKLYGSSLTFPAVKQYLRKQIDNKSDFKKVVRILNKLKTKIKPVERKLIIDQVATFARHQAFKQVIRDSIELLEKNDLETLEKKLLYALAVGKQRSASILHNYFADFAERNRRRNIPTDVIHTLIPALDSFLNARGFNRRELNVFLSGTSGGKSFALDHIAKAAVLQKKKVIIYTFEMGADLVAARLDAAFTGLEIRELKNKPVTISKRIRKFRKIYGDAILIREFPSRTLDVAGLRADLLSLRLQGYTPEVLIVDYINLLGRDSGKKDSYASLGNVYIELRGLVQELNMWGITAAQSNRGAFKNDIIQMDDIAESFEGAMHSDIILSLNRTAGEKDRNRLRIYLAKNRNELDNKVIPIHTDFKRGLFYVADPTKR